jgi:malate synthase
MIRADKEREASDGHDGTWVAHPGLVPIAIEQFKSMSGDNQIYRTRCDVKVTADQLLSVPETPSISEKGIRTNISVGIQYLESWLRGQGCVPINNLMEDAATAEISRTQLWQWVHHHARMVDGRTITIELVEQLIDDEVTALRKTVGEEKFKAGRYQLARDLFVEMTRNNTCPEFLSSIAYGLI